MNRAIKKEQSHGGRGAGDGKKMTVGPGDDVTIAVEVALAGLAGAEDASDVPGDVRFFGDDRDDQDSFLGCRRSWIQVCSGLVNPGFSG